MKKLTIKLTVVLLLVCCLLFLASCTEAERVSANISQEADNFNVERRIVVINARTDTIVFELVGTFSLQNSSTNELEVVCELEDGTFQKHFIYLSEYTLYVVEDISHSNVSKYHYELNILPEQALTFVPTFND